MKLFSGLLLGAALWVWQGKLILETCKPNMAPRPEPIDVLAVQDTIPIAERAACGPAPCTKAACFSVCMPPETKFWTCADKKRILLTAENGDRWCHAPQLSEVK